MWGFVGGGFRFAKLVWNDSRFNVGGSVGELQRKGGRSICRSFQLFVHRDAKRHAEAHRDTHTRTHRHTDTQTRRHADTQTQRHTDANSCTHACIYTNRSCLAIYLS